MILNTRRYIICVKSCIPGPVFRHRLLDTGTGVSSGETTGPNSVKFKLILNTCRYIICVKSCIPGPVFRHRLLNTGAGVSSRGTTGRRYTGMNNYMRQKLHTVTGFLAPVVGYRGWSVLRRNKWSQVWIIICVKICIPGPVFRHWLLNTGAGVSSGGTTGHRYK